MGAIAEAIVEYTRPLLDTGDGSPEQMQHAMMMGQLCWNLALLPEDQRDQMLEKMRPDLKMNDAEFEEFRRGVIEPMIERHHQMFPRLHQKSSLQSPESWQVAPPQPKPAGRGKYPGTGRYDPCPCGSGEKYKFCCGRA